jgi:hypothetical protein
VISTDQLKPALMKTILDIERYVNFNMSGFLKYIIIPFSFAFGMLMGMLIVSGEKDFIDVIYSLGPKSLLKIGLILIIGSGIMIPVSQYMNKKLYKQHLDKLKEYLIEFEEIE